jgi:hypothetical protein
MKMKLLSLFAVLAVTYSACKNKPAAESGAYNGWPAYAGGKEGNRYSS